MKLVFCMDFSQELHTKCSVCHTLPIAEAYGPLGVREGKQETKERERERGERNEREREKGERNE